MKNYEFLNTLVLRIPRYTQEHMDRQQKEVLQDPVFRDAIFLASECIYDEMKKRDFDPDRFPGKLLQTLQKYHRRMCCRPTPFGGFSSLSVLEWGRNASSSALEVCESSFHTHIQKKFENPQSPPLYYLNPAIYMFGKNYRLCEGMTKDDQGRRIYNLFEIKGRAIPAKLLEMSGKFKREDFMELYTGYGLSDSQAEYCFLCLADCHVILQADTSTWKEIEALPSLSAVEKSSDLYAVTLNEVKGFLDPEIREKLLEGIHCLNQLNQRDGESDLDQFKLRFTDLFDKREVPLLSALDPEAGIDYGQNASWMITNEPEFELKASKRPPEWGKVQELLLRKWTEQQDMKSPVIRIEKEDLLLLKKEEKPMLSQAVIFNMQDGQVCLHAAGGSSAAALIGRFTIFDDRISEIARGICLMEQEANPEVIFAEIIHDSEDKTDRLNNRTLFRDYVIPVLTDSPAENESRIELNDLYLSIKSGQLILRSKRLNKRIIPRLGTSYNYQRNPLAIYRLLCDLQNEGINPGASLSMSKLLPGLRFYPRVCYKDVILETASWYPDPQVFSDLYKKPAGFHNDFLNYADKLGLPEMFIYEQNDQRLLIRKNNEKDIRLLIETVKNQKIIVLREFLSEEKALVKDEKGGTYVHELVAFLVNKESVYAGLPITPRNNKQEISRFHPLKDWHFLKIYMHPAVMDDFLTNILERFILNCNKAGLLDSWYFIRYKDNDDHLRIRLKIADAEDQLLKRLQIFIAGLKKNPGIRHVQLCTYERELERYQAIGIHNAETLFSLSSNLALFQIRGTAGTNKADSEQNFDSRERIKDELLNHAIFHMYKVMEFGGLTEPSMLKFSEVSFKELFRRLDISKEHKTLFDQKYREAAGHIEAMFKTEPAALENEYYARVLKNLKNVNMDMRTAVLADLIHMHINRLFASRQQLTEAECYYYLHKSLLKRKFKRGAVNG